MHFVEECRFDRHSSRTSRQQTRSRCSRGRSLVGCRWHSTMHVDCEPASVCALHVAASSGNADSNPLFSTPSPFLERLKADERTEAATVIAKASRGGRKWLRYAFAGPGQFGQPEFVIFQRTVLQLTVRAPMAMQYSSNLTQTAVMRVTILSRIQLSRKACARSVKRKAITLQALPSEACKNCSVS